MKKHFDWERLVPLGSDGKELRERITGGLILSVMWSVGIPYRILQRRWEILRWRKISGSYAPPEGTPLEPFEEFVKTGWLGFGIMALVAVALAADFYFRHYQGSRSIYTMRRLPDRWELWRRVLTLPGLALVLAGLAAAVTLGLYYGLYCLVSPVR